MAVYEVTDPETGKKLRLTGDAPPTEAELDAIFDEMRGDSDNGDPEPQPVAEQQAPEGSFIEGVGEAASAIGTGLAGQIAGGWSGLGSLASGGTAEEAAQAVERTQESIQTVPETETGQRYLQNVGDVFEGLSQVAKYYPAKLASVLSAPFSEKTMEEINTMLMETPASQVAGDVAYDVTGSPLAGALAQGVTEVGADLIPAGGAVNMTRGGIRQAAGRAARSVDDRITDVARAGGGQAPVKRGASGENAVQRTAQTVQRATPEEMAAMVNADPKILQAIESLEIDADPIYSQISRNPQYREVEGGLRSMPGSELNAQAIRFIDATKRKADELIESFGGVRDKALLSQQFEADSLSAIDDLAESANQIYGQIDQTLMKSERAVPQSTVEFLYSKSDELGGVENLQPKFRRLLKDLEEDPTIGLIDQRRKDMGQAAFKNAGLFKDAEEGFAKAVYGRLTDDMNTVLDDIGLKELSDQGKSLVIERKTLENNLQELLGKKLQKDLSTVVGGATKGLASGRVKEFTNTINRIPKEYRQKAVVTALNDVFRGRGQGMDSFNANDYLKFWNELQRNPRARTALFKELPKGSRGALAGLAEIAKGINQADRTVITTGRIQSFFEPNTGLVSKMLGNVGRTLAASKAGPAGSAMYNAVSDLLSQSTSPAKRTAELIATPQFQSVVKKAIDERIQKPAQASEALKKAEKKLAQTRQYQEWVSSLAESDKIPATAGFLTFLLTEGSEEAENGNNNQQ